MGPAIDQDLCDGCGECVTTCPNDALALSAGKVALAHPDSCNYCAKCEEACPEGAIDCGFEIVFERSE